MKRTIVISATGAASVETSRARLGTTSEGRVCACPSLRSWRIKAFAKAVFLLATVLCFAQLCLADGKVFPPVAFPANVTMPDQRALIHFTNGTERLVIETRFTGAGTNFAWIVPLPAQPVIEEATTGLFPTLQYLFRPQIKHDVPRYYAGVLTGIFLIWLLTLATRSVWSGFLIAVLLLLLAALLLPTLSMTKAKSAGMGSASADQAVSVLDRQLVGIFETTTIASQDPTALQSWLRENGFAVSTNSEPVIASYVKDGWVFVAAKVRRDKPESETSTPHPLSFTFKTDTPVYPMRLTGVDNGPLQVELYVFGPERAEAAHFKVERCTQPTYPEVPDRRMMHWLRWSPERPSIVHPLLRKWVGDAPAATKLTAKLTPAQMREDVRLDWTAFSEKTNRLYSRAGALTCALNWGTGVFAVGLLGAGLFRLASGRSASRRFARSVGAVTLASTLVVAGVYSALPKTEARLVKRPFLSAENAVYELLGALRDTNALTSAEVSAEARRVLADPGGAPGWMQSRDQNEPRGWTNPLLGGTMREEDSPGNFLLRANGDEVEFVGFDAQGAEHVLDSWSVRRPQ